MYTLEKNGAKILFVVRNLVMELRKDMSKLTKRVINFFELNSSFFSFSNNNRVCE